jgi:soluble lytic murein transglycosylase
LYSDFIARAAALLALWIALSGSQVGGAGAQPPPERTAPPSIGILPESAVQAGDAWTAARLFAEFGEHSRALGSLSRLPASSSTTEKAVRLRARLLSESGSFAEADSTLDRVSSARDPRVRYLDALHRARLRVLLGDFQAAIGLDGVLESGVYPEFEPYRDLLAVESLLAAGRDEEACRRARQRLARGLPASMSPRFEMRFLDALVSAGRARDALGLIEALKTMKSRGSTLAPAILREVEVRCLMEDSLGAVRAAVEYVASHPPTEASRAVEEILVRIPPERIEAGALLDFADACLETRRFSDARRLLDALSGRRLAEPQMEAMRLATAELLFRERRTEEARRESARPFSEPDLERRAKLLRARILRAAGRKERAAVAYEVFADDYPLDPLAPEALFVAADLFDQSGRPARAGRIFARIVEAYPVHAQARRAAVRLALDLAGRAEYPAAVRTLENAIARHGAKDETLLYYLATFLEETGRTAARDSLVAEIAALDPGSFYLDPHVPGDSHLPFEAVDGTAVAGDGQLIRFLGRVHAEGDSSRARIARRLAICQAESLTDSASAYLARGRAFLEMGFQDWAAMELDVFESCSEESPRSQFELAVLFDEFAMPWKSIPAYERVRLSLNESARRELGGDFDLLMHPLPYPSVVTANCVERAFPPHLAYAMIREESRFHTEAVSRAGAHGLMQIMPSTGEQIAGEIGASDEGPTDLLLADVNLAVGIAYASRLLGRANGDPLMMLAAYNAGFSNAAKWFGGKRSKTRAPEKVDLIEFGETRNYVKRVVGSARVYHSLYFSVGSSFDPAR